MCYDAYSFNLETTLTCWSGTPFDYVIRITVFFLLLDMLVYRSKNIAKLIENMQFRSKIWGMFLYTREALKGRRSTIPTRTPLQYELFN